MMETVIFCHGMPGSVADADLLRRANPDTKIITLSLLDVGPAQIESGLQRAFDAALADNSSERVNLVGFSIGAMAATKLAVLRPNSVSRLTLISPAAPLSLGDFLPNMAGKPVFLLARKYPKLLALLTRFQSLIVRLSPDTVINMLFAKCGVVEQDLLKDPLLRTILVQALSASIVQKPDIYVSYIRAYVADWSDILLEVKCPVALWHGTRDTWSPPEMSKRLEETFGKKAVLNWVDEAEHYSTLAKVVL